MFGFIRKRSGIFCLLALLYVFVRLIFLFFFESVQFSGIFVAVCISFWGRHIAVRMVNVQRSIFGLNMQECRVGLRSFDCVGRFPLRFVVRFNHWHFLDRVSRRLFGFRHFALWRFGRFGRSLRFGSPQRGRAEDDYAGQSEIGQGIAEFVLKVSHVVRE